MKIRLGTYLKAYFISKFGNEIAQRYEDNLPGYDAILHHMEHEDEIRLFCENLSKNEAEFYRGFEAFCYWKDVSKLDD